MLTKIKNLKISYIIAAAAILRLALYRYNTLELDFNTFHAWSLNLSRNGFVNFYNGWSDYLPGYLYVLWFLGKVSAIFPFTLLLYKLPAMLADLATGYLIYKITLKYSPKYARLFAALFLFNPAIIANSTFWGQVDVLTAFFSLLTIYLLPQKIKLSALSFALGMLIKPQVIFIAPAIGYMLLKKRISIQKIFIFTILSTAVFALAFIPFGGINFISIIIDRLSATLGQYPYTSINTFNFWGFIGMWKPDNLGFYNLKLFGYAVSALLLGLQFVYLLSKKYEKMNAYYLAAFSLLTGFTFFTRIHERHMLPYLVLFLIYVVKNKKLLYLYFAFSGIYVLNLTYSFVWISEDFRTIYSPGLVKILSLSVVALYFAVFTKLKLHIRELVEYFNEKKMFFKPQKNLANSRLILLAIVLFALTARLFNLYSPPNEYFDEVYHAFTARKMLHGDPRAWEWWNPNPQGFAWEWTHPPLAKLGMVLGMSLFGENAFGWRSVQAILGTACVYLTYKISKALFEDELAALLAAAVLSLDGLVLVISRIGMNDIYFLFFMLFSFYLFIKDKFLFSSLMLGFAAASKWSVFWFLPLLPIAFILLKKKFKPGLIFYFLVPPLIYVLSYLPMFASNHDWSIFIGVQKQMWWYHTNLVATHYYTSPWWSWPLLIKPIWLYTSGASGAKIANIYAFGNPIVFWFGLVSVLWVTYFSIKLKNPKLLLIIAGYFIFFVPWALSPRIMFLYHYLPSLPFLAIAVGLVLRQSKKYAALFLILALLVFIYLYPHLIGLQIPIWLDKSYYLFPSWK